MKQPLPSSNQRFRGTLAYAGRRYAGFQRQAAGIPTIQGAVEEAISAITQQPTTVIGCGRTDAGVHASGQVIAFDCRWKHSTAALWRAINSKLPSDMVLKELSEAAPGFHPRYDAISRRYIYQFYTAPVREPTWDFTSWYVGYLPLDIDSMQAAAHTMLGTHDFATFGQPTIGDVTLRTLHEARFSQHEDGYYRLHLEANAFLKHMVRSIMGTLAEVGRGKMTVDAFAAALQAADRSRAGQTAPPHGLNLVLVRYGGATLPETEDESKDLDTKS